MRKDGPWVFEGFMGEEEYFCRGTQEVLEEGRVMWCRCGQVRMDGINTCILVVAEEKERDNGKAMFVEELGLVVVVFQKEVSQKIYQCDCVRRLTERLKLWEVLVRRLGTMLNKWTHPSLVKDVF